MNGGPRSSMLDEADCELVQVGLEMLMSDPLVRPAQPRVAVPEHTMPLRQRRLGLFRVPLGARTVAHRPRGVGARPAIGDDDAPRHHVHRYEAGPGRPRPEAVPRISTASTPSVLLSCSRPPRRPISEPPPEGSPPSTFSCHRSRSGHTMAHLRLWRMAQAVSERPIPRCRRS